MQVWTDLTVAEQEQALVDWHCRWLERKVGGLPIAGGEYVLPHACPHCHYPYSVSHWCRHTGHSDALYECLRCTAVVAHEDLWCWTDGLP